MRSMEPISVCEVYRTIYNCLKRQIQNRISGSRNKIQKRNKKLKKYLNKLSAIILYSYILRVVLVIILEFQWFIGHVL